MGDGGRRRHREACYQCEKSERFAVEHVSSSQRAASTGRYHFKNTVHPSRPEAEGLASVGRGIQDTGRPWPFASAARVAREDPELLEPIFQWRCLLAVPKRPRRKADRPQEAPERQASERLASEWPAFEAALSVAVLEGKD